MQCTCVHACMRDLACIRHLYVQRGFVCRISCLYLNFRPIPRQTPPLPSVSRAHPDRTAAPQARFESRAWLVRGQELNKSILSFCGDMQAIKIVTL